MWNDGKKFSQDLDLDIFAWTEADSDSEADDSTASDIDVSIDELTGEEPVGATEDESKEEVIEGETEDETKEEIVEDEEGKATESGDEDMGTEEGSEEVEEWEEEDLGKVIDNFLKDMDKADEDVKEKADDIESQTEELKSGVTDQDTLDKIETLTLTVKELQGIVAEKDTEMIQMKARLEKRDEKINSLIANAEDNLDMKMYQKHIDKMDNDPELFAVVKLWGESWDSSEWRLKDVLMEKLSGMLDYDIGNLIDEKERAKVSSVLWQDEWTLDEVWDVEKKEEEQPLTLDESINDMFI
jgi:hypothetical protein